LLGDNVDTIKKSIETSKQVDLEVKAEKTKYMLLSRHQNAGQNHDIKIGNRSFENVAQFRYLGTTITDRNLIQEEIQRRLNSGNFIANFFSVYGEALMNRQRVSKWCREFETGRSDVHDQIRSGRPSVVTDEIIPKTDKNIRADRRLTIDELHQQCPDVLITVLHV
ncbi:hypothetical protein B7P43_G14229, partial [Cryptotermes secundus]